MLLAVLDIGSNTGHLAVYEVEPGQRPVKTHKLKEMLRLADHVDASGALTRQGLDSLLMYVRQVRRELDRLGCALLPVATATLRDAPNRDEVLAAVRDVSGIELTVLTEEHEARATFLAVARWLGERDPGRIGVVDIGGGSLEVAVGTGEVPEATRSWRLGARRLTRDWLSAGRSTAEVREHIRSELDPHVPGLVGAGIDRAVGTSWTMRMLGEVCGNPVHRADVAELAARVTGRSDREVKQLIGVPRKRAGQVLAGALVADVVMERFGFEQLEICQWALREGVLLQHLDRL